MILSLGLTRFVDAEIMTINGVEGVFIPIRPNGDLVINPSGERSVYCKIGLLPDRTMKKYDYVGRLLVPESSMDSDLEIPDGVLKRKNVVWGFATKTETRTGFVTVDDFNSIVGE